MTEFRRLLLLSAVVAAACRTGGAPHPGVDLAPAREALEAARQAGAPERAPETFSRASSELREAERLVQAGAPRAETEAVRAEGTARLAQAEANRAAAQADAQRTDKGVSQEQERLAGRLRRAEEEQRRLEEHVVLLRRDLEDTETELIRTKARLKGIETKAEASSAIAEARILARRLDPKSRSATLTRCQELLAKAEQQMNAENFGAAAFFALKAQDMAVRAREAAAPPETEVDRPAPRPSYVAKAASLNLRRGPSTSEEVMAKIARGEILRATAVRGDWLKVSYRGVVGWVHSSLVE